MKQNTKQRERTMTKLYNVTVNENGRNVKYLEMNGQQVFAMLGTQEVVKVEVCSYTEEDKLAHCERFGNN